MSDLPITLTIAAAVALTGFSILKMSGCIAGDKIHSPDRNPAPASTRSQ